VVANKAKLNTQESEQEMGTFPYTKKYH